MGVARVDRKQAGFTLVELLIVTIILVILAAIIVPQFSATTDDVRTPAYDANLAALSSLVNLYRQQHGEYPGATAAAAGTCDAGTNETAAIGAAAFITQMTHYTNSEGIACTRAGPNFPYGPYLNDGLPNNPLGNSNTIAVVTTGEPGLASGGSGGWRFDSITGELIGDH